MLALVKIVPYHIYNLSGKHLSIEDVVHRREQTCGRSDGYRYINLDDKLIDYQRYTYLMAGPPPEEPFLSCSLPSVNGRIGALKRNKSLDSLETFC